jgi:hypothetical protein
VNGITLRNMEDNKESISVQIQLCDSASFWVIRFCCPHQVNRITLRNKENDEESIVHLSKEQEADEAHYKDSETGAELEVIDKLPLLEYLANSYKKFGCQLEFITNKSQAELPPFQPCLELVMLDRIFWDGRHVAACANVHVIWNDDGQIYAVHSSGLFC